MALDRAERLRLIEVAASVVIDSQDVLPFAAQLEQYVLNGPVRNIDPANSHTFGTISTRQTQN